MGQDGWLREKITKLLKLTPKFLEEILPGPDYNLSITLVSRILGPYAHIYGNLWNFYLEQQSENLDCLLSELLNDNEKAFVQLLRDVLVCENELEKELETKGYETNTMVHVCGLMVIESFSGHGIAQKLIKTFDDYIRNKKYTAIVVETTNSTSRYIYEKSGYHVYKEFLHSDYGMNSDDKYTILYKIL